MPVRSEQGTGGHLRLDPLNVRKGRHASQDPGLYLKQPVTIRFIVRQQDQRLLSRGNGDVFQQSHARGCIRVLLAGCRFQGSSGLIKLRTGILPGELHAAAGIENPQVKVVYLSLLAFQQARTCLGPVGCRTHADVYRRGHAFRDTAAPKQLLVRTAGKNGQ